MALDFEERNRKRNARLRSLYDYTMGVLWMAIGVFFLWYRKLGLDLNLNLDKTLTTIFGASALLYGAFRLYRGYKAR